MSDCQKLYLDHPPSTLEKKVEQRYKRYQEQMQQQARGRRGAKPADSNGPSYFAAVGVGLTVLAGVAVVAGIVTYRWMHRNGSGGGGP